MFKAGQACGSARNAPAAMRPGEAPCFAFKKLMHREARTKLIATLSQCWLLGELLPPVNERASGSKEVWGTGRKVPLHQPWIAGFMPESSCESNSNRYFLLVLLFPCWCMETSSNKRRLYPFTN